MNSVNLIGRLTKDPDVRYGAESGIAIARFSIAIDRGKTKDGESRGTDFPKILCFGKTAEIVEKYLSKGDQVGVEGSIQTGKYEKDGQTSYTTEVLMNKITFISGNKDKSSKKEDDYQEQFNDVPEGFATLTDDDIPF